MSFFHDFVLDFEFEQAELLSLKTRNGKQGLFF